MSNLEEKDKKERNFFKPPIIIFFCFLILTTIELLIFLPKIKKEINKSGIIEIMQNSKEEKEKLATREVQLFYIDLNGKVENFPTIIKKKYDYLHDTFEREIKSPPPNALEKFCISYIPNDTYLIGATQKEKSLYINVSKQILNSKDFNLCYKQLEATAKAINKNATFVLLIEGEIYSKNKESSL